LCTVGSPTLTYTYIYVYIYIYKRWGSHIALDGVVLDLYLRGPEDDLTRVETCSPKFMYIYTTNKLLC